MLHSIMVQFDFDLHTVRGVWSIIGMVIVVVILVLIGLRVLRPVNAEQFDEQELENLLAAHQETHASLPANVADA